MDTGGDKFGYIRKTGAIGVCTKAIAVSGSTRGTGSLGAKSESGTGLAKRAKIEGNESAKYEKLEKRSLRSMKEGGSEKELRRGHNFFGDISKGPGGLFGGGGSGPSAAERRTTARRHEVGKIAKSGESVDAAKNPVLAARVERKRAVTAAKQDVGVKAYTKGVRQVGRQAIKAAKQERRGFTAPMKKEARQAERATFKSAKQGLRANRKRA